MNALIVDDEVLSREYIADLLAEYCPDVHIAGRVSNVPDALKVLNEESVDVVFLDVRMQQATGFDLLKQFEGQRTFEVIFTTAYNHYAVEALRHGAADYLLKPIDKEDFQNALQRLRHNLQARIAEAASEQMLNHKLSIHHQQGFKVISLADIQYIEAAGSYTVIKLKTSEKIVVSSTLKKIEDKLPGFWFYRIHKSYIINLFYFREYLSSDGGSVVMHSGDTISVSRYKLTGLLKLISDLTQGLKV